MIHILPNGGLMVIYHGTKYNITLNKQKFTWHTYIDPRKN